MTRRVIYDDWEQHINYILSRGIFMLSLFPRPKLCIFKGIFEGFKGI